MVRYMLGLALCLAGTAAAATDPVFGRWLVEDGKAVVEIAPCGDEACGRLVWLQTPWQADGDPKRDSSNPEPAARTRPLCGLQMISGLERAGDGVWKGGKIYSARDGRTYGLEITAAGPDRLSVRGYVGISLLGGSQEWVREDGRRGSCTAVGRPERSR